MTKIFEVILEKEIKDFNKSESKELENPEKDPKNIEIIKSIKLFKDDLKGKKKKKEEKKTLKLKNKFLKNFKI